MTYFDLISKKNILPLYMQKLIFLYI